MATFNDLYEQYLMRFFPQRPLAGEKLPGDIRSRLAQGFGLGADILRGQRVNTTAIEREAEQKRLLEEAERQWRWRMYEYQRRREW